MASNHIVKPKISWYTLQRRRKTYYKNSFLYLHIGFQLEETQSESKRAVARPGIVLKRRLQTFLALKFSLMSTYLIQQTMYEKDK